MRLLSFVVALCGLFTAAHAAVASTAQQPAPAPAAVPALTPENSWHLDLTTGGRVTIQLRPDVAPGHVERIKSLTRQGFYDGLIFHRVIEGFMAQGGDPLGTGRGGSELPDLAAEINGLSHLRGAVAMARGEELNSANSQFYIMFVPRLPMDKNYTVFGRVVSGMNFVNSISRGEPPLEPTRIVRASIGSDNVPPMTAEQLQAAAAAFAARAPARAPAAGALTLDGATLLGTSESKVPTADASAEEAAEEAAEETSDEAAAASKAAEEAAEEVAEEAAEAAAEEAASPQ